MTARKFICAIIDRGEVLLEVVRLFQRDEREAALAVASKLGVPAIDLSRAGTAEHLPCVMLFEADTPQEEILKAVRDAAKRQRRAIERLS